MVVQLQKLISGMFTKRTFPSSKPRCRLEIEYFLFLRAELVCDTLIHSNKYKITSNLWNQNDEALVNQTVLHTRNKKIRI
jgi:hypothetical protein